jgi:hypothetical protein
MEKNNEEYITMEGDWNYETPNIKEESVHADFAYTPAKTVKTFNGQQPCLNQETRSSSKTPKPPI